MKLEMFINFNGNCREAVEFYAKVFKSEAHNLMTYADAPPDPNNPVAEEYRARILYAGIPFGDTTMMFMDASSDTPYEIGDNINPTLSSDNKEEITRIFNELSVDGEVYLPLQPTFFSELYGMVKDKFGVVWQILHYVAQ